MKRWRALSRLPSGFVSLGPIQIKPADGRGLTLLYCDASVRFVIKLWSDALLQCRYLPIGIGGFCIVL